MGVPVGARVSLEGLVDPLTSNMGLYGEAWEGHGLLDDDGAGNVDVNAGGGDTEALLLNQVHDDDQVKSLADCG